LLLIITVYSGGDTVILLQKVHICLLVKNMLNISRGKLHVFLILEEVPSISLCFRQKQVTTASKLQHV